MQKFPAKDDPWWKGTAASQQTSRTYDFMCHGPEEGWVRDRVEGFGYDVTEVAIVEDYRPPFAGFFKALPQSRELKDKL